MQGRPTCCIWHGFLSVAAPPGHGWSKVHFPDTGPCIGGVTLFFLAFLPQFAKPELGNVPLQIVTLGLLFQLATLAVFGGVSFLGGRLAEWFNASIRGQIILNRITACIFTALALLLIFSSR